MNKEKLAKYLISKPSFGVNDLLSDNVININSKRTKKF